MSASRSLVRNERRERLEAWGASDPARGRNRVPGRRRDRRNRTLTEHLTGRTIQNGLGSDISRAERSEVCAPQLRGTGVRLAGNGGDASVKSFLKTANATTPQLRINRENVHVS